MMTTVPGVASSVDSDAALWLLACQGSELAFEVLVRRYQSMICAVAYSVCGNLALSEDVAQETFWTVWRQRASLEQPDRLGAWLRGIARNIAKNARRKLAQYVQRTEILEDSAHVSTSERGPAEEAISREQELLVWQALGRITDAYREPLILFYREDRPVADVAAALSLSENAVKKRLSRGRSMLREEIARQVESALHRTRPGTRFTGLVMAGLAAHGTIAKPGLAAAGAGMGTAAWKAAGAAGAAGGLGGLMGTLVGLLGGWFGTWVPAQAAPTRRERESILHTGKRVLLVSVVFLAALSGLIYAYAGTPSYLVAWGGWMMAFWAYMTIEGVLLARLVQRIRAEQSPDDLLNDTALRNAWTTMAC
ncbi:MAG: RNA polymerase sigma factor [Isosphaeraceae bacterium]